MELKLRKITKRQQAELFCRHCKTTGVVTYFSTVTSSIKTVLCPICRGTKLFNISTIPSLKPLAYAK